jgi:membrane protease YdiL (CAAX protease family)
VTTPAVESPRRVWTEVLVVYLGTLVAIRVAVQVVGGLPGFELLLAIVPILFMYVPVWSCRLRGADPWDYPMALPSFQERAPWVEALRLNLVIWAVVAVPFVLGYHAWQTWGVAWLQESLGLRLYPKVPHLAWTFPSNPLKLVAYHLFYVAIPEEMFYRGYLQSRLEEILPARWTVLGTRVGPALLVTCVLFAFGHSIVILQWWHVFIVVPSLAFGWLRARTNGIIAGAFFHAWCNITVATLDTLYGIVPPGG